MLSSIRRAGRSADGSHGAYPVVLTNLGRVAERKVGELIATIGRSG